MTNIINKEEIGHKIPIDSELAKGNYKGFLYDFGLGNLGGFNKSALERANQSFTRWTPYGYEGREHYKMKMDTFNFLWARWYIAEWNKGEKFIVMNEVHQERNPFKSFMHDNDVLFSLDIGVFRLKDKQIFSVEIDNREHNTAYGIAKSKYRDAVLKDRYGVRTFRINMREKQVPFKKLEEFIFSKD